MVSRGNLQSILLNGQRLAKAHGGVLERLSSGLRINRASDDAAGEAVATKLSSDAKVFSRGADSAASAVTLFQTAEDATEALSSVITRLRELAVEAQGTTLTAAQRQSSQEEVDSLRTEYARIVETTTYNGQQVFSASQASVSAQIGPERADFVSASLRATTSSTLGNGTFGAATTLASTVSDLYHVAAADFDADGNQDIVFTDRAAGRGVQIRLGNGDGSFGTAISYAATDGIFTVDVGDVNGDGNLDIVGGSDTATSRLVVYLGNGDGTFQAQVSYVNGDANANITVADVNNDGIDDVLASSQGASDHYRVYFGSQGGSLTLGATYAAGGDASNAVLVDLNGDGYRDIVGQSLFGGGDVVNVLLNNGDGTFGTRVSYQAVGLDLSGTQAGDVNGDGHQDVVVGNATSGIFTVFTGDGTGALVQGANFTTSGAGQAQWPRLIDINGDSNLDVITNNVASQTVTVNLGNGNGTFGAATSYAVGANATDPAIADFNNDGVQDLIVGAVGGSTLQTRLGGTTTSTRTISATSLSSISVANRASAIAADAYLQTAQDDLEVVKGLAIAGEVAFGSAAYRASRSSQVLELGANRIRDIDAATELASHIRYSLLESSQQGIFASAVLSASTVAKLLSSFDDS